MTDLSLVNLLIQIAREDPQRTFCNYAGVGFDVGTLYRQASNLAAHLRSAGLCRGDRVAVMMANHPESIAVIFGLALSGCIWVSVNVQLRGSNLRHVLTHCDPRAIIADDNVLQAIGEAQSQNSPSERKPRLFVRSVDSTGQGDTDVRRLLNESPRQPIVLRRANSDAPFAIMYTSGTTGKPKGVVVTHGMMKKAANAVAFATDLCAGDNFFVWEPFYHIGGAQLLLLPLMERMQLSLVDRFSASQFWDQVRAVGATHIHFLGGVMQILLRALPKATDRDHSVVIAWGGGASAQTRASFADRFGIRVHECYGMTETSSIVSVNRDSPEESVGRVLAWFEVRIQSAQGATAPRATKGEICVRAIERDALTTGYFNDEEATNALIQHDWVHTGDLGWLDAQGNLYFAGRLKDCIRYRGENVSAWEVESVVAQHPGVEACAVIGIDADIGEQEIKLFVQPRAGEELQASEIALWLEGRLARFQQPRFVQIVREFERTPSLRIMKEKLSRGVNCWDRGR